MRRKRQKCHLSGLRCLGLRLQVLIQFGIRRSGFDSHLGYLQHCMILIKSSNSSSLNILICQVRIAVYVSLVTYEG